MTAGKNHSLMLDLESVELSECTLGQFERERQVVLSRYEQQRTAASLKKMNERRRTDRPPRTDEVPPDSHSIQESVECAKWRGRSRRHQQTKMIRGCKHCIRAEDHGPSLRTQCTIQCWYPALQAVCIPRVSSQSAAPTYFHNCLAIRCDRLTDV